VWDATTGAAVALLPVHTGEALAVAFTPDGRGLVSAGAALQHELLAARPYTLTLEDLMVAVHVRREGLSEADAKARAAEIRATLFGKPYPCLRASPLPKKYGWGVHHDGAGRIALYAVESPDYRRLASNAGGGIGVVAAMRSKRAV